MANEQAAQTGDVGLPKGTRLGKYEVLQRIGMGGQAVVYKCHDPMLDRPVAIKQISAHLAADPKFVERFRKEAQILAKLGSEQPAIVTIHELIQNDQGLFIVMEYLAGHSLETVLQETQEGVEPKATLQVIWRLAAALHAVHSAGIIHRDLKPGNIIVGEGLRAKITDFGVAASLSGQTSMILGTTKYMAPELFEGGRVDGRADMYSLGLIAYEMLVGRRKFNEIFADVVRDRHSEALRWMKWHGNPAVQAPPLHEVNPGVPAALGEIVAKMMCKDPDGRFESMEALGRAIKSTFSPRARAQAAAAPPLRRRRRASRPAPEPVGAGAAAADTLADTGEPPPLVPQDEGDELELGADAQATAPLPSTGVGRKILVFFVLPLVVLLVIGGAVGGVWHLMRQSAAARRAAEAARNVYDTAITNFQDGLKTYDQTKFVAARDGFVELQKKHPGADNVGKASVWQLVCEAYIAAGEERWEDALAKENAADERINAVQRAGRVGGEWPARARGYVKNFHSHYISTRTFREAMTKAARLFEIHKFDDVREVLSRELRDIRPTPAQEAELLAFRRKVDLTEFASALQTQIQQGNDLAARNKFQDAEAAYQKALEMLQDDRAAIMPADERKKTEREVATKLTKLTGSRELRDAIEAADKARASGDKQALLAALTKLQRLQPMPARADEIATINSQIELERGRKLKEQGRLAEARQAFERSIKHKDNKEAQNELALLDKAAARTALVTEGDRHFTSAKWAEALAKYTEAGKLGMDDALARKIVECRYRIELAKADQLRAQKKYDEAIAFYERARKAKPSADALIKARLDAMAADRQYEKHIADGLAALKREQYAKALEYFNKAKEIRETQEVKDAIAETRYRENLTRGREALEQKDYQGALGYFNVARRFKDTKEIQALIAEAQKKKEGG